MGFKIKLVKHVESIYIHCNNKLKIKWPKLKSNQNGPIGSGVVGKGEVVSLGLGPRVWIGQVLTRIFSN